MPFRYNPFTGSLDYFEEGIVALGGRYTQGIRDIYAARVPISKNTLVRSDGFGFVIPADTLTYNSSEVLGIAVDSVVNGQSLRVHEFGRYLDGFFAFPENEPLFLSDNGIITNVPATSGFHVQIGKSLSAGVIFVDIQEQIEL